MSAGVAIQAMAERPPYVRFERRPQERRHTLEDGGGTFFVEVDIAIITPQGSKDVHERVVADWFHYMEQLERMQRWNPAWTRELKASYKTWQETETVPLNGTPVANWPVATVSEVKILRAINLHTVEDLAVCTEEALQRIGMGGRSLRQRAQDWLAAKNDAGPLVEQLNAQRIVIEDMKKTIGSMQGTITALSAQLGRGYSPPPAASSTEGEDAAEAAMDRILG